MKNPQTSRRQGFTLVELLVVIAIIATLAGLGTTAAVRFRNAADKTTVLSNMRQLQVANVGFASDNNGQYVSADALLEPTDAAPTKWYDNPTYLSYLTSETAQSIDANAAYQIAESFLDPTAVEVGDAGSLELFGSYAYNTEAAPTSAGDTKGFRSAQVTDPARSMAFITAPSSQNGIINFTGLGSIAYRHKENAVIAYYDGHSELLKQPAIATRSTSATDVFWKAN